VRGLFYVQEAGFVHPRRGQDFLARVVSALGEEGQMSWTQPVYSSHVAEVGYDSDTSELLVTWQSGRVSAYVGVAEELAVQIANAPSVGQALNAQVKNVYSHRYVR
jgi:hypothetical protein